MTKPLYRVVYESAQTKTRYFSPVWREYWDCVTLVMQFPCAVGIQLKSDKNRAVTHWRGELV